MNILYGFLKEIICFLKISCTEHLNNYICKMYKHKNTQEKQEFSIDYHPKEVEAKYKSKGSLTLDNQTKYS